MMIVPGASPLRNKWQISMINKESYDNNNNNNESLDGIS